LPTPLPQTHVEDALKLKADGRIHLFELSPLSGGTIYFKDDNDVTWQGNTYEGLPCSLSGEEFRTEGTPTPKLTIGQDNLDLLPFKGLINDGKLDGATLVRKTLLLDDLINNRNIKQVTTFRVKRIDEYSRTKITVTLASFSQAQSQTLPFRQYVPPAFPWVDL
jgi:phage-related protein